MAKLHDSTEQYSTWEYHSSRREDCSTLELIEHDQTATTPERDYDANAPEPHCPFIL